MHPLRSIRRLQGKADDPQALDWFVLAAALFALATVLPTHSDKSQVGLTDNFTHTAPLVTIASAE